MKKITHKISYFFNVFQIIKNKSRKSCFFNAILGLIKSRNVQLPSIAEAMKEAGDEIQVSSIIHRLEDFFREVIFDYDEMASLLVSFLDGKEKIRLCIDRTEWDFGKCQVNILMLMAYTSSTQVPLYWELLDNNSGNSNAENRIDIIKKVVNLIGVKRIGLLLGDREFIGHHWIKYLKDNHINFCLRIPKGHSIEDFKGHKFFIEDIATEEPRYFYNHLVDKVWVNVMVKKLVTNDYLFLISNLENPKYLAQLYKKRWKIEVLFQSFKQRGFDLESTQMKCFKKLKKLVGMVCIAYSLCVNVGTTYHEKVQKIKIKNHGYKSKSFCRLGIDLIKDLCKKPIEIFNLAVEKILTLIIIKKLRKI